MLATIKLILKNPKIKTFRIAVLPFVLYVHNFVSPIKGRTQTKTVREQDAEEKTEAEYSGNDKRVEKTA